MALLSKNLIMKSLIIAFRKWTLSSHIIMSGYLARDGKKMVVIFPLSSPSPSSSLSLPVSLLSLHALHFFLLPSSLNHFNSIYTVHSVGSELRKMDLRPFWPCAKDECVLSDDKLLKAFLGAKNSGKQHWTEQYFPALVIS